MDSVRGGFNGQNRSREMIILFAVSLLLFASSMAMSAVLH